MDIPELYNQEVPHRQWYLNEAWKVTKIVAPDLTTLGDPYTTGTIEMFNTDIHAVAQPYSDAAGQALSELAHGTRSLLLPASVPWFRLGPPAEYKPILPPEAIELLDKDLAAGEVLISDKMAEHGVYGKAGNAFRRLYAEGQVLTHVSHGNYRTIPLRCFTVNRYNGVVERIIFKEELKETEGGARVCLYTLVDYNAGKVYQQRSTHQHAKVVDFKPVHYFVTTSVEPNEGKNYSVSFARQNYGTIHTINLLSKKILEITHNAAINLLALDPTMQMTISEFKEKLDKGDNVFEMPVTPDGRAMGIGFVSAQSKLADLAALIAELQRQEAILAKAFSLGINSNDGALAGRERVTAQEIVARNQQIDANAQSHAATLQSTYQQPLVNAYLDLLNVQITLNDGASAVRPIILAGANMLSRMVQANQLLTTVDALTTRNPQYAARINYDEVFLEVAQAQGLQNPERFLLQAQPMAPAQPGMEGPNAAA